MRKPVTSGGEKDKNTNPERQIETQRDKKRPASCDPSVHIGNIDLSLQTRCSDVLNTFWDLREGETERGEKTGRERGRERQSEGKRRGGRETEG